MFNPNKNSGVIIEPIRPLDYIAGGETGLVYEESVPEALWDDDLPSDEGQSGVYFDSMACVSFSALNLLETKLNWRIRTNQISPERVQWLRDNGYFDDNGKINFSDRFTAKMSGTTRLGNSLQRVWDSIRNDGLAPERDWNFPSAQRQPVFVWEDYYAEIPQAVKDKALKFLELFKIQNEWVVTGKTQMDAQERSDLLYHLKQSPLQLVTPTCPPWDGSVIAPCGKVEGTHATLLYGINENFSDFDHYVPYRKQLSKYYCIPFAMKGEITARTTPLKPKFTHFFNFDMRFGQRSTEIKFLQEALKNDGVFPKDVQSTGYYGTTTQTAVRMFQAKYGIGNALIRALNNGKLVGTMTRTKLNQLFS